MFARLDETESSLSKEPERGKVYDPVNGLDDLSGGVDVKIIFPR